MPWGCLVSRSIAIHTRSETLAPLGIILLDLHIGITKTNSNHGAFWIADVHRPLLRFARCVEGFAKRDFLSLVFSHIKIGIEVNPATP